MVQQKEHITKDGTNNSTLKKETWQLWNNQTLI